MKAIPDKTWIYRAFAKVMCLMTCKRTQKLLTEKQHTGFAMHSMDLNPAEVLPSKPK